MAHARQLARVQALKALAIESERDDANFQSLQARARRKGWQLVRTRAGGFLLRNGSYSVHSDDLSTVAGRLKG